MKRRVGLLEACVIALLLTLSVAGSAAADPVEEPLAIPRVRAVDPSNIWNFKLVADSSVDVRVKSVSIDSGDLIFGLASSDPDQCSGRTLTPSDTTGCSLVFMMGTRGVLRVSMDGALDQFVAVGSPLPPLPTEGTAPPQPAEPDTDPLIELDQESSWQDGRVTLVNRRNTFTVDSAEIVAGGGLAWASAADADACRGLRLAPDGGACTLRLRGTSGMVRLRGGLATVEVDVDLSQLRPATTEVRDPSADTYLQALSSSSSTAVTIENVGAQAAAISSVDVLYGGIGWDPDALMADTCTGATVPSDTGSCTLRLDGSGVVRFNLQNGERQDVVVKAGEFADPADTWPSVRLWQRSRPLPSADYDYVYTLPTGPITGWLNFGATGESQARLDKIEAWVDDIPLGAYSGTDNVSCAGTSCLAACETTVPGNPLTPCASWFWGLSSDQVGSKTQNVPFMLNTARLANGAHTIRVGVTGTPQAQRTSYAEWQISSQNPQPVTRLSGGLFDNQSVPMASGSVTATTDSTPGVAAITLSEVSGRTVTVLDSRSRTCSSVCSPIAWTTTLSVDPIARGWSDGTHWLRLRTTSATGAPATIDWTVDFYRAGWLYGGLNDSGDFTRLETDLYTGSNAAAVWGMLRQADRAQVLTRAAGYLLRERSEIGLFAYFSGRQRHKVPSPSTFGLSAANVRVLPDGALSSVPFGGEIRADSMLVREGADPAVFYLAGGVRYWITSPAVAAFFRLDLAAVVSVPPGFFRWVPRGQDVGMSGVPGVLVPPPTPAPTTTPPPKQKQAFVIGNASYPDTYRFTPTPAAGLHLVVVENGTRVVWANSANQVISSLATATATDEIGRNVRTTYRLEGASTVLIDVFHRAGPARYPVVVDTDASYWDDAQADRVDRELMLLPGPDGSPVAGAAGLRQAVRDFLALTPAERDMCLSDTALCWNWKGDKIQAANMMEHLYNGRDDADRRNAFKHSFYTGLAAHSTWSRFHTYPDSLVRGRAFADAHESEQQRSSDINQLRRSNMDLHNNEQGYYWSRHGDDYTRNETAICNAMRNRTDVARRVSWTSARTSWPRDRLVYFDTPTTRRPGTSCSG